MSGLCANHNHCVSDAINKAEIICNDQNISLTPLRKKILKLLWAAEHKSVKAYDLLDKLRLQSIDTKPITLYRILDFLVENNLIHKIESLNSFIGCNHPTRRHDCTFLICYKCENVEECCNKKLSDSIALSVKPSNFKVRNINLEIHGICKNCIQ